MQLTNAVREEGAFDERESFLNAAFAAATKPEHLIGDRALTAINLMRTSKSRNHDN